MAPISFSSVGWGEPAPIASLIVTLHYAGVVNVSPWSLALLMFSLLLIHWFMHSVLGSGGGTWRSLLRSSCALTLFMIVSLRLINDSSFFMATILISSIICCLDSIQGQQRQIQAFCWGIMNWAAIICLIWLTVSSQPSKRNDGGHIWNWACLIFSADLLACPIQDMSIKRGFIWQAICAVCLPIITVVMNNNNNYNNNNGGGRSAQETFTHLIILPCILLSQRKIFWHWIVPLVVSEDEGCSGIRVIYCVACCGSLALCAVNYRPLEITLLALHFGLHWLAHVCRGIALLMLQAQKKSTGHTLTTSSSTS
jgi:hypothetical protein